MENLGTLSKSQRRSISLQLLKQKESISKCSESDYLSDKNEFESQLNKIAYSYYNFKLSHNGIVSFKSFENCNRNVSLKSLNNLLNYNPLSGEYFDSSKPFDNCLGFQESEREIKRRMTEKQSKECKKMASKLCYYTRERTFVSKKTGKYKFKIAFLTLTAPNDTTLEQFLKAFELFCDYLRRTANCVFVWKKEFGKKDNKFHVHFIINNFIPYYIVSWKWKRLLISQGVIWPENINGQDTSSHYRIELPKNKKQTGAYISKYMSKIDYCPENVGYLWGCSKILKDLKEITLMEGEVNNDELYQIYSKNKTVGNEYVKICLLNWFKVSSYAESFFKLFEKQFFEFQNAITLEQRFCSV